MGFDVGEATVRVLEGGLPPLPSRLEPSQTVPVALWRGKHYGAVLFVRLWKNGNVDSDCAISKRATDGSWEKPWTWGGSSWIDDPLVRSETGWDGDPAAWLGSYGIGFATEEDGAEAVEARLGESSDSKVAGSAFGVASAEVLGPDELAVRAARREQAGGSGLVRALRGAASSQVAGIEVKQAGRKWTVHIDSPCGAFIVGLESPGPATLRVLGHEGQPLANADGETEHVAY